MRIKLSLSVLAFVLLLIAPVSAQLSSNDTGIHTRQMYTGDHENINPVTGNVNIVIPLVSFPQRGGPDYTLSYSYNSNIWVYSTRVDPFGRYSYSWSPESLNGLQTGWTIGLPYLIYVSGAALPGGEYCDSNFVVVTPDGGKHSFPSATSNCYTLTGAGGGVRQPQAGSGPQQSIDFIALNPDTHVATLTDGTQIGFALNPVQVSPPIYIKDRNGNQITFVPAGSSSSVISSITDTAGRAINLSSGVSYVDDSGTPAPITFSYAQVTVNPVFPYTPVTAPAATINGGTWTMLSAINLPNQTSYTFAYNNYGELIKITYPTGGYTKYDYDNFNAGNAQYSVNRRFITAKHVCRDSAGACSTQTEDTTYYSVCSDGSLGSPCPQNQYSQPQWTLTGPGAGAWASFSEKMTDPLGNATVVTRDNVGNTHTYTYNGGTLLRTVDRNLNATFEDSDGLYINNEVVTLDGGKQSRKDYTYGTDINNPTEVKETGYDGIVIRDTKYTYASNYENLTNHIYGLKTATRIYDASNNLQSETDNAIDDYSAYGLDGTNNSAFQHDTNYSSSYTSRGNITRTTSVLIGGTNPVTYLQYDTLGNVVLNKDPGGHITMFSYADSFKSIPGCAAPSPTFAYLTQITNALSQVSKNSYFFCSGLVQAKQDPNDVANGRLGATFTYDNMHRPGCVNYPDTGQTCLTYSDTHPFSITKAQVATPDPTITTNTIHDGLGRVITSQVISDPTGATTDTTYDPLGRVVSVSNPHGSSGSTTDGVTRYAYDALDRVTQVAPPDGTTPDSSGNCLANNVCTSFSGNTSTVTDQAGAQRRSVVDALGRLIEVDEPGGGGPLAASGSVTVTGSEGSYQVLTSAATSGSGSFTVVGAERSTTVYVVCGPNGTTCPHTEYDGGTITVTINGFSQQQTYGPSVTTASLASALASGFNGSGSPVTASVNGATVTVTARASGAATNYSLSSSCASTNTHFTGCSFSASVSGGTLTGGRDAIYSSVYDSGTIALTVGTFQASSGYQQSSTASSLAGSLANVFNMSSSSPVTASTSGATITLTAKQPGDAGNYTLASSSNSNQPGQFSPPSFGISSGAALTGGTQAGFTLSSPAVTQYKYDPLGNLLCVVQKGTDPTTFTSCASSPATWRPRSFVYDSLSRLTNAANPETGTATYTYDADGNVTSKSSPAQNQTNPATTVTLSYCYDGLHRLGSKAYTLQSCPMSSPAASYGYDQGINGIGRRTSMSDSSGSAGFTYDPLGRVLGETRTIGSVTKTVGYQFDLAGAMKSVTYPSNRVVNYVQNGGGRTVSAIDPAGASYVSSAVYNAPGELVGAVNGSAITVSNNYNKRLQPSILSASTTAQTLMSLTYDFHLGVSDNGNIYQVINGRDANRTQNFTYDALNRIQKAWTTGPNWGESFTVDAWGNLTNRGPINGKTLYENFDDAPAMNNNQLAGFGYDAAGNMNNNGGVIYTYDSENRISATAGWTYTYDGDGTRVKKAAGSLGAMYWGTTGTGALAESDLSGNLQSEYIFFNGSRVARLDLPSGVVHYYFSNHIGSTSIVSDASGNVQNDSDYYPYGGEIPVTSADPNHYKFTGKERDTESALDESAVRYYGSNLGRWISPDPMGGHAEDPQTFNRYTYVRNNPLTLIDPTGLDFYLSCQPNDKNGSTCQQQQVGTDSKGKPINAWVQGTVNQDQKFTATQIGNDKDGNLVDKTTGTGAYTGTFDGKGVTLANAQGAGSSAVWLQGSAATDGIQGTGGLNNFNFKFFNHNNEQTLNAEFGFGGTHEQAARALLNAGFKHWALGIHWGGDEFRLPAQGPNSTHFTITSVTHDPKSNVPTTHGDMHTGEYYPGWNHTIHDVLKVH